MHATETVGQTSQTENSGDYRCAKVARQRYHPHHPGHVVAQVLLLDRDIAFDAVKVV